MIAETEWILRQFPHDFQGYAIEVGAYDGVYGSTTIGLEDRGWTCLAIEPNPDFKHALYCSRPNAISCACGKENLEVAEFHVHVDSPPGYSHVGDLEPHPVWHAQAQATWKTVPVQLRTLNSILEELKIEHVDAVTIDTEGTELDVLLGFDLAKYRPKVLVVEAWTFGDETPLRRHMKANSYACVDHVGVNDYFHAVD